MVFGLCDEEDFVGLLQSAEQPRGEREASRRGGRKLEKRNEEEVSVREKVTRGVKGLKRPRGARCSEIEERKQVEKHRLSLFGSDVESLSFLQQHFDLPSPAFIH